MAEIHSATSSELTRELVADVVAFIRQRESYWANQAATLYPDSGHNRKVADAAIYEVWTDAMDDLGISFAVTLASHGIGVVSDGG